MTLFETICYPIMTKEEMVNGLKKRIIDSSLQIYIEIFDEAKTELKQDKYWIDAATFYKRLSKEEKSIILRIVRQIQIDTLSEVFAYLDGVYWVEGQEEDLKLVSLDNPEEKLNEDLLDTFHNMIYEAER
jgi:hypothetical protein